jgi:hypothetical protein
VDTVVDISLPYTFGLEAKKLLENIFLSKKTVNSRQPYVSGESPTSKVVGEKL